MVVNVVGPGLFQINWGIHTSLGIEDNEKYRWKNPTDTTIFYPTLLSHCRKHETIGSDIES